MTKENLPVDSLLGDNIAAVERASYTVHLTLFSLLVDKGLVTHKEAAARLSAIRKKITAVEEPGLTKFHLDSLTEAILNAQAPDPSTANKWSPTVVQGGLEEATVRPSSAD